MALISVSTFPGNSTPGCAGLIDRPVASRVHVSSPAHRLGGTRAADGPVVGQASRLRNHGDKDELRHSWCAVRSAENAPANGMPPPQSAPCAPCSRFRGWLLASIVVSAFVEGRRYRDPWATGLL